MPVKCLPTGFRHVRLRNLQNQALELSTLFVYSKQQLDHMHNSPTSMNTFTYNTVNNSGTPNGLNGNTSIGDFSLLGGNSSKQKHKQFKLTIYSGLNGDEDDRSLSNQDEIGIQVKVTQETTVQQVIDQVTQS